MNTRTILLFVVAISGLIAVIWNRPAKPESKFPGRKEVVFWHFWGGEDKQVVESVVERFNRSQNRYVVRAIAMPGNNLQAKLFLSVAGGDPPDLVNQDDPILPDWSRRGVIHAMDEIADESEVEKVTNWLLESAQRLSRVDGRTFAICNGLDIRALYFNKTELDKRGLSAPKTIQELDEIADAFTTVEEYSSTAFGYLPDSRRIWAWGYVFGADFFDRGSGEVKLQSKALKTALSWMVSYPERFGADRVASFRQGDQSLPGKSFPLLPTNDTETLGRYAMIMDGQWRVRDIRGFQELRRAKSLPAVEFGVCPLPMPAGGLPGRQNAGWVNGNFFVIPRGAKNSEGAWEFIKFWIGYENAAAAAQTCSEGGWIPVSDEVMQAPQFKDFLEANPLFRDFVELAASPNQFPIPAVPGSAMFRRAVEDAAYEAMTHPDQPVAEILSDAEQRIQQHLDRSVETIPTFESSNSNGGKQ